MDVFSMLRGCRQAPIPHLARHVLMCVIVRANQKGQMWASLETLAGDTSTSRMSVHRSVRLIVAAGLMRPVGKRNRATAYVINEPELAALANKDSEEAASRRAEYITSGAENGNAKCNKELQDVYQPDTASVTTSYTKCNKELHNPPKKEPMIPPPPPVQRAGAAVVLMNFGMGGEQADELALGMDEAEATKAVQWALQANAAPGLIVHRYRRSERPWANPSGLGGQSGGKSNLEKLFSDNNHAN